MALQKGGPRTFLYELVVCWCLRSPEDPAQDVLILVHVSECSSF